MFLSIIIPAYNVEKYLAKCLDSCVNYDLDYEIIVVNDGSTDTTLSIAKRYEQNHANVVVVSQENQGLSMARNNGLMTAQGNHVWFVDSDDSIVEGCLYGIHEFLTRQNPDILQLQYQLTYEDGSVKQVNPCIISEVQTGPETLLKGGLPAPAQFSIYRRAFLNENALRFYPGIYHEDSEFKPRATYFAASVVSYDKVVYNYLQRSSGSITSSYKLKNAIDAILVNNHLLDFAKENVKELEVKRSFYRCISLNLNTLFSGIRQLSSSDYNKVINHLRANKHQFRFMLKSKRLKYVLEGCFFVVGVRLGLLLHKVIR